MITEIQAVELVHGLFLSGEHAYVATSITSIWFSETDDNMYIPAPHQQGNGKEKTEKQAHAY